jgi:hypothetical protein
MSAHPYQRDLLDSDPDIKRRVRRRLDYTILPILCFFMFVSFLDRGNIGNAKIQGMTKDLHMGGNDYNIAVMLFTVAYIIFGLPASLIFKKTGTQSLSVMMFLWGIVVKVSEIPSRVRRLMSYHRGMCDWRRLGQDLITTPSATLLDGHVRVWVRSWLCLSDQFLLHAGRIPALMIAVVKHCIRDKTDDDARRSLFPTTRWVKLGKGCKAEIATESTRIHRTP